MTEQGLAGRVGIGITTKDRWDDLSVTLGKVAAFGLAAAEVVVIDDGSTEPAPAALRAEHPGVTFIRYDESRGYIARRNELGRLLNSEFYLSLDDDSYPHLGDLARAADWLDGAADCVALAFPISRVGETPASISTLAPLPLRSYIGCSHLLKRKQFVELGGYTEELFYFCEETDFALKAQRAGLSVWFYPPLVIHHFASTRNRNHGRANFFLCRNTLLIAWMRVPFASFARLMVTLPLTMLLNRAHRPYAINILRGWFAALGSLPRFAKFRAPLTAAGYREWKARPVPLQGLKFLADIEAKRS